MKKFALLFALVVSSSAFARQYIQCGGTDSYSTEVAVVNLTTPTSGTFFASSGMQNPEDERLLVDIVFEKTQNGKSYFKVVDNRGEGTITLPTNEIGKKSDYLKVEASIFNHYIEYSCFSRIYND